MDERYYVRYIEDDFPYCWQVFDSEQCRSVDTFKQKEEAKVLLSSLILLHVQAREAAKSLIRPYVLSPRHRWTLKALQENLTESSVKYHASIGRSAFWEGEREGDTPLTNPQLLELPLTKIGVYRIGKVTCEEMFDLAEIYREVCDEEKEVIQVALFS